jgi:hypothetical protein
MNLEITQQEQQQLLACIESAIKSAPSSLQAAALLLPLAQHISELREQDATNAND